MNYSWMKNYFTCVQPLVAKLVAGERWFRPVLGIKER